MIRDLLKWVAPGAVTVVGGTAAALAMATPAMLDSLASEGRAALEASGSDWGRLAIAGRHFQLTGTTSSDTEREMALAALLALNGVASVGETVTIAPLSVPFRTNVSIEEGAVSLFGDVPNEELRHQLLSRPGLASVDLQVRAGQADDDAWQTGLDFALAQSSLMETGYFELSGLTLNTVGRANTEKALGQLQMALAQLPEGISGGAVDLLPVLATPYTWRAEYDGSRIAISGHVPEERLADRLRLANVGGIPIATGLSLASGEPEGFALRTRLLVEQLARLETGEATIVDGVTTLRGVPPTMAVAQAVTEALSGTDSIVQLSPPRIPDYWLSINRQPGGVLVFDGYVPDEATRARLSEVAGADVSYLKYGAGAPQTYHRAVDFGLELLGDMTEGRVSLVADTLSISGEAQSPADYRELQRRLETGLPQGVSLGELNLLAPRAANYHFAARRDASGSVMLEGLLPNPAIEAELLALAGSSAASRVDYASGETPNFTSAAEQALDFLPWLRQGSVGFDGTGWIIEGEPASAIDRGSIESEFAIRGLARAGWSLDLSEPMATTGFADPYVWSAERLADGSFLFAGHVPAAAMQSYLKVHVGTRVADTSVVANGAPVGFASAVRSGVDALLLLEEGRVAYDGDHWTLRGTASDSARKEASLALVAALELSGDAQIEVPEAAPVEPYQWAAIKAQSGSVTLQGAVPAQSLQRFLAVRAGADATDTTQVRADAPDGFASEVIQALDVLALLSEGEVRYDGQHWSARGTALSDDADSGVAAILGTSAPRWTLALSGPATVDVAAVGATAVSEQPTPRAESSAADPAYAFRATRTINGQVTLAGQVPAQATADFLSTLAGTGSEDLVVSPGAPEAFIPHALAGVRALLQLRHGELSLADGAWTLSGEAANPAGKSAIEAELAALGAGWSVAVTAPSGLAECRERVLELSAHNAILFQSGAAIIAASASAELDDFAVALALCPEALVDIEGHTDSDGDDRLNLALSVARAEAVVNALIERGIAPERLYAIGYGETQPVADNATAEGKRANRRIVVTVRAPGGEN